MPLITINFISEKQIARNFVNLETGTTGLPPINLIKVTNAVTFFTVDINSDPGEPKVTVTDQALYRVLDQVANHAGISFVTGFLPIIFNFNNPNAVFTGLGYTVPASERINLRLELVKTTFIKEKPTIIQNSSDVIRAAGPPIGLIAPPAHQEAIRNSVYSNPYHGCKNATFIHQLIAKWP